MASIRTIFVTSGLLLLASCAVSLPTYQSGTPCLAAGYSIVDDFTGARRGRCVVTSDDAVRISILKEDSMVINESPWFSFKIIPEPSGTATSATIAIQYFGAPHRYQPKTSIDGLNWTPVDDAMISINGDGDIATLRIAIDDQPIWVSAQELITPTFYKAWIRTVTEKTPASSFLVGKSKHDLTINGLDAGSDLKDVLMIVGRQHPPEVSGAFAFFAFAETLLGESELATAFRSQYRIIAIPLLNPDGVIKGNWRHNLGDTDLNRDWGPFTQPETAGVRDLLERLDDGDFRIRMFADFHSTKRNLLYTQNDDFPTSPPDFVPTWLASAKKRILDYEFTNEASEVSDQANSKNYMYKRYGIPSVTFEVGDETDRDATRRAAVIFAEELMQLLLCTKQSEDFKTCQ